MKIEDLTVRGRLVLRRLLGRAAAWHVSRGRPKNRITNDTDVDLAAAYMLERHDVVVTTKRWLKGDRRRRRQEGRLPDMIEVRATWTGLGLHQLIEAQHRELGRTNWGP